MDLSDHQSTPISVLSAVLPVLSAVPPVFSASHSLFPLCLYPLHPRSSSRSRRIRQSVGRERSVVSVVNDVIRALNTVYF